jgi:vitamin B12 transporter
MFLAFLQSPYNSNKMRRTLLSCISLLTLFLNQYALAQQKDTTIVFDEIIIHDNRLRSPVSSQNRSIEVIDSLSIKSLPVQSVQEILSYSAGVDLRQRGPLGVQSDLGFRGGSFEQSLLLINGIKMSDPQTGHHMMNIGLPMECIKQVEVIKGPASRKFGPNAFAGAVNIITKIPEDKALKLGLSYGDFNLKSLEAGISLPGKTWSNYVSVNHFSSNGYRNNTDFNLNNILYLSEIKAGEGTVKILGALSHRNFGASGYYVPNSNEWEEVYTGTMQVLYEVKKGNWQIDPRVYYRYNNDHYVYIRDKPEIFQNYHTSETGGAEVHFTHTNSLGLSGFGIETRIENLQSTNLRNHQREMLGVFAEHRFLLGKFSVCPGVYVNQYPDHGFRYFPGIDAGYAFNTSLSLFANTEKSFRVPSYTDLYYVGPNNIGNPDLQFEDALSSEVGVRYTKNKFVVKTAVYNRNATNLIDWVKANPDDAWQAKNLHQVNIQGFEIGVSAKELNRFIALFSIDYNYIDASFKVDETSISRYALSNVRHQAIARVVHSIYGNIKHSLAVRHVERVNQAAYTLIDSKLFWAKSKWEIYAEATNLANTQYVEAGFVPMPGRWFRMGVSVKLGL